MRNTQLIHEKGGKVAEGPWNNTSRGVQSKGLSRMLTHSERSAVSLPLQGVMSLIRELCENHTDVTREAEADRWAWGQLGLTSEQIEFQDSCDCIEWCYLQKQNQTKTKEKEKHTD